MNILYGRDAHATAVRIKSSITGIGLVTPLGRSARGTFDALLAGRVISTHTRLESSGRSDLPRVVSLAIEAADEAIVHAGWTSDRNDVAVIACTSKGSIESWLDSTVTRASGPCPAAPQFHHLSMPTMNARAGGSCHDEPFGLADL
jgi:3-oxoacyl-(acyl-carrier-protein) synthase